MNQFRIVPESVSDWTIEMKIDMDWFPIKTVRTEQKAEEYIDNIIKAEKRKREIPPREYP